MATKEEVTTVLLANVQRAEKIAVTLSEADLTRPVYENGWTVKEVFAHLAAMGGSPAFFLGMAASGGGFSGNFDVDALNSHQVESRKARPLLDLLAEFRQGHEKGVALINATPDEVLEKKVADPFMGGMSTALELILNSCSDYEGMHLDDLVAALRR